MYANHFGLQQEPFSIAPDPRYLFMSERHREALAHLLYGAQGGGGFVLLTGEIGAGKTLVCRCFLQQIPAHCRVAYIFNPKLTVRELLRTICEEFGIALPAGGAAGVETRKPYIDAINAFLLRSHAQGHSNVLIIDEAQNLSAPVLEQLRLLTNLETPERKLLQIMLIGQPELRQMLAAPELEQLAQRVIARYHLGPLGPAETADYVRHRLGVAGLAGTAQPFEAGALRELHRLTRGVPRRINLLCDRALLGAYARGARQVDRATLRQAAAEVFDAAPPASAGRRRWPRRLLAGGAGAALLGAGAWLALAQQTAAPPPPGPVAQVTGVPTAAPIAAPIAAPPAVQEVPAISLAWGREADAWRDLARRWGQVLPTEAGDEPPCQALQRQPAPGLQCFRSSAGLGLLRLLDRPAILTLRDAAGRASHVSLLGLDERHALVQAGEQRQRVPLLALGRQWQGEFQTLWRVPPAYQGQVLPGPGLDWLGQQLARVFDEAPPRGPQIDDAALRARVAAFQRAQGLRSDGRAGPITLMQLNRVAGAAEPRLQPPPTPSR